MQRFVVPAGVLRAKPNEFVRLMQLGALANAMLAVASMSSGAIARGVGERRDTLQLVLVMASYFNEAIETIDHRRCWELIEAGVKAGYVLPKPLAEARKAFSRGKGSLYKTVLYAVRRKKGFHVDKDHFIQWLDAVQAPEITLWRK